MYFRWAKVVTIIFVFLCLSPSPLLAEETESRSHLVLTLDDAINMALERNQSVLLSVEKVKVSESQILTARGAFFPQISASGNYTKISYLPNFAIGESYYLPVFDSTTNQLTQYVVPQSQFSMTSDRKEDTYLTKIGLQWSIFTGGRVWDGYQLAKIGKETSEEALRRTRTEIVCSVKQAFYDLLLMQAVVKVTEEAIAQVEAHVKTVKRLYENGMVSKFDLLRAEVQLTNMQPQLIRAKNGLELAKTGLNTILNIDLSTEIEVKGEMIYQPQKIDLEQLTGEALANRPELKEIVLRKEMGKRAVRIARAGYLPTVALFSDYQWKKGQDMPPKNREWLGGWDAGLAVNVPIFDGFINYGKVKEAKSNLRQIELGEEQLTAGIKMEVKSVVLNLVSAEQTISSQEKNVEQAKEALRIAQARYENGQATNLDVLDAQVALTQAETNYVQALHDYLIAQAKLEKAIGK
ncbi:MAG: TolC family protein [Candidatus Edwardsbacteria bacterium]